MKQSNIVSFFDQAKIRKGASVSQYGRVGNRDKIATRDIFTGKDPSMIYQKMLKKEQQQYKVSGLDNPLMDDHSSQNSSQMFPNSQNSLSHIINSSESNDTPWMQEFTDSRYLASNPCRSKQKRNFRYSANWNAAANSHDINQYYDDFKRRAKEKDDREMIATFITLVKECCEETKAAVNASCDKCEGRVTEGVAFVLDKVENASKKLENMENLFKTEDEYEDKVHKLEMQLQEKSIELSNLQREMIEVRDRANCQMMAKLTEAFNKGQKVQSDKIEELVSKASDIHTILRKPKMITTDMWSQYSPRLDQPSTLTKTNKINLPNESMQIALPSYFPNGSSLQSTSQSCSNFPPETHRYTRAVHLQQPTSNIELFAVNEVFDNMAVPSSSMEPKRCIATEVSSAFKPISYYGVNNQHFVMRSPMPQRRVAFGNMKKDSPVIAVRPFVQDLCTPKACHTAAAHRVEESGNFSTINASWEGLVKSQQREWFSRSTRSSRNQKSGLPANCVSLGMHKMPPSRSTSVPAKVRRSKRKKSNFTRKGPAKRTRKAQNKTAINNKTTENSAADLGAVQEFTNGLEIGSNSTACGSRNALSVVNTNVKSIPSYAPTIIKQETLSPLLTSLRGGVLPSKKWPTIVDMHADSTCTGGVIVSQRSSDKVNRMLSSDASSVDWAGF